MSGTSDLSASRLARPAHHATLLLASRLYAAAGGSHNVAVAALCHERLGGLAAPALLLQARAFPAHVKRLSLGTANMLAAAQAARNLAGAILDEPQQAVAGSANNAVAAAMVRANGAVEAIAARRGVYPQRPFNLSSAELTAMVARKLEGEGATLKAGRAARTTRRGDDRDHSFVFMKAAFLSTWYHNLAHHETEAEARILATDLAYARCKSNESSAEAELRRIATGAASTHLRGKGGMFPTARAEGADAESRLTAVAATCARILARDREARRDLAAIRKERAAWREALLRIRWLISRETSSKMLAPAKALLTTAANLDNLASLLGAEAAGGNSSWQDSAIATASALSGRNASELEDLIHKAKQASAAEAVADHGAQKASIDGALGWPSGKQLSPAVKALKAAEERLLGRATEVLDPGALASGGVGKLSKGSRSDGSDDAGRIRGTTGGGGLSSGLRGLPGIDLSSMPGMPASPQDDGFSLEKSCDTLTDCRRLIKQYGTRMTLKMAHGTAAAQVAQARAILDKVEAHAAYLPHLISKALRGLIPSIIAPMLCMFDGEACNVVGSMAHTICNFQDLELKSDCISKVTTAFDQGTVLSAGSVVRCYAIAMSRFGVPFPAFMIPGCGGALTAASDAVASQVKGMSELVSSRMETVVSRVSMLVSTIIRFVEVFVKGIIGMALTFADFPLPSTFQQGQNIALERLTQGHQARLGLALARKSYWAIMMEDFAPTAGFSVKDVVEGKSLVGAPKDLEQIRFLQGKWLGARNDVTSTRQLVNEAEATHAASTGNAPSGDGGESCVPRKSPGGGPFSGLAGRLKGLGNVVAQGAKTLAAPLPPMPGLDLSLPNVGEPSVDLSSLPLPGLPGDSNPQDSRSQPQAADTRSPAGGSSQAGRGAKAGADSGISSGSGSAGRSGSDADRSGGGKQPAGPLHDDAPNTAQSALQRADASSTTDANIGKTFEATLPGSGGGDDSPPTEGAEQALRTAAADSQAAAGSQGVRATVSRENARAGEAPASDLGESAARAAVAGAVAPGDLAGLGLTTEATPEEPALAGELLLSPSRPSLMQEGATPRRARARRRSTSALLALVPLASDEAALAEESNTTLLQVRQGPGSGPVPDVETPDPQVSDTAAKPAAEVKLPDVQASTKGGAKSDAATKESDEDSLGPGATFAERIKSVKAKLDMDRTTESSQAASGPMLRAKCQRAETAAERRSVCPEIAKAYARLARTKLRMRAHQAQLKMLEKAAQVEAKVRRAAEDAKDKAKGFALSTVIAGLLRGTKAAKSIPDTRLAKLAIRKILAKVDELDEKAEEIVKRIKGRAMAMTAEAQNSVDAEAEDAKAAREELARQPPAETLSQRETAATAARDALGQQVKDLDSQIRSLKESGTSSSKEAKRRLSELQAERVRVRKLFESKDDDIVDARIRKAQRIRTEVVAKLAEARQAAAKLLVQAQEAKDAVMAKVSAAIARASVPPDGTDCVGTNILVSISGPHMRGDSGPGKGGKAGIGGGAGGAGGGGADKTACGFMSPICPVTRLFGIPNPIGERAFVSSFKARARGYKIQMPESFLQESATARAPSFVASSELLIGDPADHHLDGVHSLRGQGHLALSRLAEQLGTSLSDVADAVGSHLAPDYASRGAIGELVADLNAASVAHGHGVLIPLLASSKGPAAPQTDSPVLLQADGDDLAQTDAVHFAWAREAHSEVTSRKRNDYPDLWNPGEDKDSVKDSDGEGWVPPDGFGADSTGMGEKSAGGHGAVSASESEAARRAGLKAARLVMGAPDPLPSVSSGKGRPKGHLGLDLPQIGYVAGDRVDIATGRGWLPARVVGRDMSSTGYIISYTVVADVGDSFKGVADLRLRWHREFKCSNPHVGLVLPGISIAGIVNPAMALGLGMADMAFSPNPVLMPFHVTVGWHMMTGPWLSQAGGNTCGCPCPVQGHNKLTLSDCVDMAKQEIKEKELEEGERQKDIKIGAMMQLFSTCRGRFNEARENYMPFPPPIILGTNLLEFKPPE